MGPGKNLIVSPLVKDLPLALKPMTLCCGAKKLS